MSTKVIYKVEEVDVETYTNLQKDNVDNSQEEHVEIQAN